MELGVSKKLRGAEKPTFSTKTQIHNGLSHEESRRAILLYSTKSIHESALEHHKKTNIILHKQFFTPTLSSHHPRLPCSSESRIPPAPGADWTACIQLVRLPRLSFRYNHRGNTHCSLVTVFIPSSRYGTIFSFRYTRAGAPPGRTCVAAALEKSMEGVFGPPFVSAMALVVGLFRGNAGSEGVVVDGG